MKKILFALLALIGLGPVAKKANGNGFSHHTAPRAADVRVAFFMDAALDENPTPMAPPMPIPTIPTEEPVAVIPLTCKIIGYRKARYITRNRNECTADIVGRNGGTKLFLRRGHGFVFTRKLVAS